MRASKTILVAGLLGFFLIGSTALAQSTNRPSSPVVVETGKVAIPTDLQDLIKKFEAERKTYLTEQEALLAQLKHATTPAQRVAIRAALQANRDEFLADLRQVRQDLKQEISELKDKLNNTELDVLIQEVEHQVAAHNHHGRN